VLANDGIVTDDAKSAFEKALTFDATLLKPRFWLAMAAEQDGRFAEAAESWRGMLKEAPADAPWRPVVEQRLRIAEAHQSGGQVPPESTEPASAGKGPSAADVAAAQNMSAEERSAMINQMVSGLAERLAKDGKDLQGWLKLVRAYTVLGRRDDATQALTTARQNFSGNSDALAQIDGLAATLGL
jgi:cytochrome c-type biogenesis protein CcmH